MQNVTAAALAQMIQKAIADGVRSFRQQKTTERPYAFALIGAQRAQGLSYAIATEEGLRKVASKYDRSGYRYENLEWEEADNVEKLAIWLRWANPDDGWHQNEFPEERLLAGALRAFARSGGFGDDHEGFEEFCTDAMASLWTDLGWKALNSDLIVGFTYGDNPRDFLRTATRANPYPRVEKLWNEFFEGEGLDIVSPLID